MERFRKLLFVALMLTVLIGSEAIAGSFSCTTQVQVPVVLLNVSPATLKDIGVSFDCTTGGSTTASFAVLSNAPFTNAPALQVFNGSASTPTTTAQGQLAEGYDNKAVIWLGVPVDSGDSRLVIQNPTVNVQAFSQGDAIALRLYYLDSAPGSSVFQSPWINKGVLVSNLNTCASFASTMPDNSLSLFIRYILYKGKFYDALHYSPDGSNKFNLTAAEGVNAGNCTNAASVTTEQNGAEIDINDTNYKGTDYKVKISYAAGDKSFKVVSAARIPKAGFSVNPSSFSITHSWSEPYSTSCPQNIGVIEIRNTGEPGSALRYLVGRTYHTIAGTGNNSYTVPYNNPAHVSLQFNCDVPGPGTYTDTVVIAGGDDNTNDIFPNQTITVTIVVTP